MLASPSNLVYVSKYGRAPGARLVQQRRNEGRLELLHVVASVRRRRVCAFFGGSCHADIGWDTQARVRLARAGGAVMAGRPGGLWRLRAHPLVLRPAALVARAAGGRHPARLARLAAARGGARPALAAALDQRRDRLAAAQPLAAVRDLSLDASRAPRFRDPDRALARSRIILRRPGDLASAPRAGPRRAVGAQHAARPPAARAVPGD